MPFEKLARTPAYHQVAERIQAAITSGELQRGDVLPTERDLSEQFGVSRATVREALRSLEARGMVRSGRTPPRRTVVSGTGNVLEQTFDVLVDEEGIAPEDVVDLRSCIEVGAIDRGVLGARLQWDDIADALERMGRIQRAHEAREPASLEDFLAAYDDFHLAVVASSGSRLMHMTMRALQCALHNVVVEGFRHKFEDPERHGELGLLVLEHRGILDALEAGDSEHAKSLVRKHDYDFFFGLFYGDDPNRAAAPPPRPDAPSLESWQP